MTLQVPTTTVSSSTGSFSPWSTPGLWDAINIAGVQYGYALTPGIGGSVTVKRACRAYKWDHKKPRGASGTVPTFGGLDTRPFDLLLHCWTGPQFDYLYDVMIPCVSAAAGTSLSCYHPQLFMVGITAVVIDQFSFDHVGQPGDREYDLRIEVHEFRLPPPVNATKTPAAAKQTTSDPTGKNPGRKPSPAVQAAIDANKAAHDRLKAAQGLPVGT
jgi:hypothetical protein